MITIKKQLFEQFALIAHSLGSPQRIELLDYLAQAERSVEELSQLSGLMIANTSRHIQILKTNGLVSVRKQGKNRLYQLAGDDVIQLISSLRITAKKHLAEVDRLASYMAKNHYKQKTISSLELSKMMSDQDLMIIDVRPQKEFEQGHIYGAINISPNEVEEKSQTVPIGKTVVAYCRGPYCAYSAEMLEFLRSRGIHAWRLDEGFPEWKAAGLSFESSMD